jgi:SAM-dependent methyltransferase
MSFWDQQYAVPGFKYGLAPNAFLVSQVAALSAGGDVLVPGDGEGRNGVWLAEAGFRVTTVDSSNVAVGKARALAAARGVSLDAQVADLSEWTPPPHGADALVLVYVHFPPAVRPAIHRRLLGALRPGGVLVLEAFHPSQLGRTSGGPKDVAMLYTLDALRADLAGAPGAPFEERLGWEGEVMLDEGPGHQGAARVTRLVAVAASSPVRAPRG